MNAPEIMDFINEAEETYPVHAWEIDGIHVWPLIRIKLATDLFNAYYAGLMQEEQSIAGYFRSSADRVAKGLVKFIRAYASDYRKNSTLSGVHDAVFLSDGISFAKIGGAWYEKYCDPFISRLHDADLSCLMLTPSYEYLVPRHSPSRFIQPALDWTAIRSMLPGKGPADRKQDGFADFVKFIKSRGTGVQLPAVERLHIQTARIRHFAAYFRRLLEKARARAGFVVAYYGIEGMSFVLACRQAGIPSIDIQHGLQGELHKAYGRWTKVPETGYELLPSHFWCWSTYEASVIRQWSAKVSRWHAPVAGGNLWLMHWRDETDSFIEACDRRISDIKTRSAVLHHVLVTLQPEFSSRHALEPLIRAARMSGGRLKWWFRLHPIMLGEEEKIKAILRAEALQGVEIDNATDLPLYALLRHMDVHVTFCSSTVYEAESFGVPSVVINKDALGFFPEQVSSGWVRPAYSGEEILHAIDTQLSTKNSFRTKNAFPENRAFDDLVTMIRGNGRSEPLGGRRRAQ